MVLTEKQKKELNSAILDYLKTNGFESAAKAFEDGNTVGLFVFVCVKV
jgi:hypothetical protein